MLYMFNIKIAYAIPEKQFLLTINTAEGSTVKEAIIASGILLLRNEINLNINKVGIYNRLAKLTDILQDGDRVEIYRKLLFTPKDFFLKNLKKIKTMK
ncbi:UPF0125 protein RatB [Candidatus Providencia siddallii]|uniref:UPF0125 protein SOFFGTOCOR_0301 n=1 Tax=Candidatus Providencia siddallii TaxID=1715285 RepID=A0A0M6W7B1_9GAMM|nr:UPF0125 protein RatB [Candidatus Providencia siddallii]